MSPEETIDLFNYLRSLYGGRFKHSDTEARAWWKHLQGYSLSLVRQAADLYVDQSNDDWPPNCPALKRLCRSIKRDQYQPTEHAAPQLEHAPDWTQWAESQAQRLLFTYEWEPQPDVSFEDLAAKAADIGLRGFDAVRYQLDNYERIARQSDEFTALVKLISDRIAETFPGAESPGEVSSQALTGGVKAIFTAIGATKRKKVQLYQKIDTMV